MIAVESRARSCAVVVSSGSGQPVELVNVVFFMPSFAAVIFISAAKLSSVPIGILAYEMFEDFVIKEPTNLVSNYVSPFNINK